MRDHRNRNRIPQLLIPLRLAYAFRPSIWKSLESFTLGRT